MSEQNIAAWTQMRGAFQSKIDAQKKKLGGFKTQYKAQKNDHKRHKIFKSIMQVDKQIQKYHIKKDGLKKKIDKSAANAKINKESLKKAEAEKKKNEKIDPKTGKLIILPQSGAAKKMQSAIKAKGKAARAKLWKKVKGKWVSLGKSTASLKVKYMYLACKAKNCSNLLAIQVHTCLKTCNDKWGTIGKAQQSAKAAKSNPKKTDAAKKNAPKSKAAPKAKAAPKTSAKPAKQAPKSDAKPAAAKSA
jgi:hypothetical protein